MRSAVSEGGGKPERHAPRKLSDYLMLEGQKQKVHSLVDKVAAGRRWAGRLTCGQGRSALEASGFHEKARWKAWWREKFHRIG
jgi:hypothetical protein